MTSNLGATDVRDKKEVGFAAKSSTDDYQAMSEQIKGRLKQTFRPEFLNRIDEVVIFHSLNKEQLHEIVKLMTREVIDRIKEQGIKLKLTPAAIDVVAKAGFDPEYGARPIRRAVQSEIEDRLSEALLEGKITEGATVTIGAQKGQISLKVKEQAKKAAVTQGK